MLTEEELRRYERQLTIRGVGESGQERLKKASVVIAGAGGHGTAAALYLAAAGVGTIRIIDCEQVEMSSLNRQVLYRTKDVGRNRLDSLCERLLDLNDQVHIEGISEMITEANASEVTSGADVLVDGSDHLITRLLLNSASLNNGIPFVHGAVFGFEGRLTTIIPGRTPCLGCIYRGPVTPQKFPIIGAASGVVGGLQATEAIKLILGVGHLLASQLLVYNGFRMKFNTLAIRRDPTCKYCGSVKSDPSDRLLSGVDIVSARI